MRPLGPAAVPPHSFIRIEALKAGILGGVIPGLQHDIEVASKDAVERPRLVTPSAQVRTQLLHHRVATTAWPVIRGQQKVAPRLLACRRAWPVHAPLVAPLGLAADEAPFICLRWPLDDDQSLHKVCIR